MKQLDIIVDKIEQLRDLISENLTREDRPHEIDNKISHYWHRIDSSEAEYIQKMLTDRSIELRKDQDNNLQEIFFIDDLFDKFK